MTPTTGLTQDEIERAIGEAQAYAEEDQRRIHSSRTKAKLQGLLATNEKSFAEFSSQLRPEQREEVREILEGCRKALSGEDAEALRGALDKLNGIAQMLADLAMYDTSGL